MEERKKKKKEEGLKSKLTVLLRRTKRKYRIRTKKMDIFVVVNLKFQEFGGG